MPTRHTVPVEGDGVTAVRHEAESDDWVFFSHGFLSDKTGSYERRCERAVTEGYNGVRFDHRGCGESDMGFTESTLSRRIEDLRAVIEYFEPDSFVLFGSSFGGKVAFHTAVSEDTDTESIEAIVTRAPVTYNGVFEKYRPNNGDHTETETGGIGEEFFEDLDSYDFATVEKRLEAPTAIFHGRDDPTVPLQNSLEAADRLGTDVSLHVYTDENHNFSRPAEKRLRDTVFDWLSTNSREL